MGGTDEKQNEYKSLRTRREPATAPAWALSWGIEMAKTENRKPKLWDKMVLSGVPDNLRGCWSGLYPYASRSKYQKY